MPARRFPPPWIVDEHTESFCNQRNATGRVPALTQREVFFRCGAPVIAP